MSSDFIRRESEQLATIVILCQRVIDASNALTDYGDGPDKAEETRQLLYQHIAQMQTAIAGLLALHQESARREEGGNLNA